MAGMITDLSAIGSIDRTADVLEIVDVSANTSFKVTVNNLVGISGGSVVSTSDSQTLTNKVLDNTNTITLKDTLFTLQDDGDITKQARFQLSGNTTGTTRVYTLPNGSLTLASLTGTETLTNKTITSPTINGGTIDNATVTVDAVAGHTTPTSGTIYGVAVVSSKINGAAISNTTLPYTALDNGSTWAWQAWTPTYTNLTVGNGTHQSLYEQTGKTVNARVQFTFGSTSSMGTNPIFTLPVPSVSTYYTGNAIGTVRFVAAAAGFFGYIQWTSTTTATFIAVGTSAATAADTTITSAVPATWTTGNTLAATISYEAA